MVGGAWDWWWPITSTRPRRRCWRRFATRKPDDRPISKRGRAFRSFFPAYRNTAAPADTRATGGVLRYFVDGWSAEPSPVAKTMYEWSRVVRQLEEYLGHSDFRRLTGENLIGWKQFDGGSRFAVQNNLRRETWLP